MLFARVICLWNACNLRQSRLLFSVTVLIFTKTCPQICDNEMWVEYTIFQMCVLLRPFRTNSRNSVSKCVAAAFSANQSVQMLETENNWLLKLFLGTWQTTIMTNTIASCRVNCSGTPVIGITICFYYFMDKLHLLLRVRVCASVYSLLVFDWSHVRWDTHTQIIHHSIDKSNHMWLANGRLRSFDVRHSNKLTGIAGACPAAGLCVCLYQMRLG